MRAHLDARHSLFLRPQLMISDMGAALAARLVRAPGRVAGGLVLAARLQSLARWFVAAGTQEMCPPVDGRASGSGGGAGTMAPGVIALASALISRRGLNSADSTSLQRGDCTHRSIGANGPVFGRKNPFVSLNGRCVASRALASGLAQPLLNHSQHSTLPAALAAGGGSPAIQSNRWRSLCSNGL